MPGSERSLTVFVPGVCCFERTRLLVSRPEIALVWLDFAV
jgi:hypothetical protein